jgi:hypothetical protein
MNRASASRRCAFLSMDDLTGFYTYEQLTYAHFEALGWAVDEVSWRADAAWSDYDLVVIRSPWDYQVDAQAFMRVLAQIDAETLLENSLALCRWNLAKTYLEALRAGGIAIVPTRWSDAGATLEESVYDDFACQDIVIKPVVSANANFTYRISRPAFHQHAATLARDFAERAYMVQPFLSAIVEVGEYSLFYFDGRYSHAVIKSPKPDDFRVQEEHGGEIRATDADPGLRAAGGAVMAALDETPLYARVDLVVEQGSPLLMELELIEPSLYFPYDEASPRRFAEACVQRWESRRG